MNRLSKAIELIKEVRDKLVLKDDDDADKLSLAIYHIATHHRDEEKK